MAAPPKQERGEAQGISGRRSTRLFISIPLTLTGKDGDGHTFKENTRTLIINKHGAKVATTHQVALGAEVIVENRALGRTAKANVVWLSDRASPKDPWEIGLQLTEAQNIWGIEFPPDDWQEGPPIGPGGQRLGKPIVPPKPPEVSKTPAKVAEPPPAPQPAAAKRVELPSPPPPPPATPPPAPLPPETSNTITEAAISSFTQTVQAASAANLKSFEEQLAKFTNQFGFQTQASIQEAASRLEEKTLGSLEQQLTTLEGRVRASRDELEALLARFREIQKGSRAEVEKTQRSIQDASSQALQYALKEMEGRVRRELEAASSGFVQQTRLRVQNEASAAMEALSREASKRLTTLTEDFLSKTTPELQARQKQIADQAKAQIMQALEGTSVEVRARIHKIAGEVAPELRTEMESSLVEYAGQLINRLTLSFEEQTQASTQAAEQSLQHSLEKVHQAIEQEISNAAAKVRESYQQEAARANQGVSEQIARGIEQTFKSETDAYRRKLGELSISSLEGFQDKADTLHESFEGRLQKSLQKFEEKSAKEVIDKLQKTSDDLLDSLAKQLGKHGEETLEMLNLELHRDGKELITDAQRQIHVAIQAGLDSLTLEAQTTSQEYRSHLQKAFQEFQDRTAQELQHHLEELSEKQRQVILEQVQHGIDDLINKALAQVKNKANQALTEASDTVNKQVGAAAVALKDWEDQAGARLEALSRKFEAGMQASAQAHERQKADLSQSVLEKLGKESEALLEDLCDRLQQAARVFEDKGTEAIQAKLQAVTEELLEAAAAQLRKHSEENQDLVADQLKEKQRQAISQAENLFRNSLADMLKAFIQTEPKKATDR